MAYYTGTATSWPDLQAALVAACIDEGWAWQNSVLSKGNLYVKPTNQATATGSLGEGLLVQGGTGQSGAALLNPSVWQMRCGRPPNSAQLYWDAVVFPITYHIHIHASPDEVYLVINSGLTAFYWLAWGRSSVPLPGTGLWLAGTCNERTYGGFGVGISALLGMNSNAQACPGIFWQAGSEATYRNRAVQTEANGSWPAYSATGIQTLQPLLVPQPNAWNSESVLLPVREYRTVAENKVQLLVDNAYARKIRIPNLEPLQVIELGTDRWRIYPFYKKNAADPNGGEWKTHSGTFGWALLE